MMELVWDQVILEQPNGAKSLSYRCFVDSLGILLTPKPLWSGGWDHLIPWEVNFKLSGDPDRHSGAVFKAMTFAVAELHARTHAHIWLLKECGFNHTSLLVRKVSPEW